VTALLLQFKEMVTEAEVSVLVDQSNPQPDCELDELGGSLLCDASLPLSHSENGSAVAAMPVSRIPPDTQEQPSTKRQRVETLEDGIATLFIFDWDDTMLPHTWLQQEGLYNPGAADPDEFQKAEFNKLAARVAESIHQAQKFGHVVLITNAEAGWVELSCAKFLPQLRLLIRDLKVVSARKMFEQDYPGFPAQWKLHAFCDEVNEFICSQRPHATKNIVSIGDSVHEHAALLGATRGQNCWAKSVKFVDKPSLQELVSQHERLCHCLPELGSEQGSKNLFMQISN